MILVSSKKPGMCSFCGNSTLVAYVCGGQPDTLCVGCERFGEGRRMGHRVGEHPEQRRLLEQVRRAFQTSRN
ncbi:MAG: hypothetical protein ACYCW6_22095 [Candidatus Xenobia bacterium]